MRRTRIRIDWREDVELASPFHNGFFVFIVSKDDWIWLKSKVPVLTTDQEARWN